MTPLPRYIVVGTDQSATREGRHECNTKPEMLEARRLMGLKFAVVKVFRATWKGIKS